MGGHQSVTSVCQCGEDGNPASMTPELVVSPPAVRFGALSSFALAILVSSARRSGHDGIVPVPHSNFWRMLTQSSRSSKAVVGKEVGVLRLAKRVGEQDAQLVQHLDSSENQGLVRLVALLEVRPHRRG